MNAAMRLWVKRYGIHVLCALIVGIGLWFRVFRIGNSVWMLAGFDESRDMLVARHITEYGEWIWRGPLSSGSKNMLMNSPMYYYLLSGLWFIGRSSVGVSVIWSMLLGTIMFMSYRIGVLIWDTKLGILLLLLTAIQPTLVSNSRHISQPYLLPLFFTGFLWLIWSGRPTSQWKITFGIIVLLAPVFFHYGSLLMLPLGSVWLVRELIRFYGRYPKLRFTLFIPVMTAEYLAFLWSQLTYAYVPTDQLNFLTGEVRNHWGEYISQVRAAWIAGADNIWWNKDPIVVTGILAFSVCGTAWYFASHDRDGSRLGKYLWTVLFSVVPLLVAGVHGDIIHSSYLLGMLPVGLIILAVGLRVMWSGNRLIGIIGTLVVVYIFAEQALTAVRESPSVSYYHQMQSISESIYTDYRTNHHGGGDTPEVALAVLAGKYLPYDGWGTGAVWYFLEDLFSRPLVRLYDRGVNFLPIPGRARFFYVVCDYRGMRRDPPDACDRKFRSVRTYLEPGEREIFRSDGFSVWRYTVDPDVSVPGYNMVYPEASAVPL